MHSLCSLLPSKFTQNALVHIGVCILHLIVNSHSPAMLSHSVLSLKSLRLKPQKLGRFGGLGNAQWRKVKQLQPVQLCIFSCRLLEETFEEWSLKSFEGLGIGHIMHRRLGSSSSSEALLHTSEFFKIKIMSVIWSSDYWHSFLSSEVLQKQFFLNWNHMCSGPGTMLRNCSRRMMSRASLFAFEFCSPLFFP